jgi:hypothetical protein
VGTKDLVIVFAAETQRAQRKAFFNFNIQISAFSAAKTITGFHH